MLQIVGIAFLYIWTLAFLVHAHGVKPRTAKERNRDRRLKAILYLMMIIFLALVAGAYLQFNLERQIFHSEDGWVIFEREGK